MLDLALSIEAMSGAGALTPAIPATWNPADKSNVTLTNGNLTATIASGNPGGVRATKAALGKVYAEFLAVSATGDLMLGVTEGGTNLGAWLYNASGSHSAIWYATSSTVHLGAAGGSSASGIPNASNGNVLQIAVDRANNKIWFGNGNTWTGDPAAGTGGFSLAGASGDLFPVLQGDAAESLTARFLAPSFTFTPPTGFSAW